MPIPKPKDNETQDEFISRCMGDDTMNEEYPKDDQRAGVCHSQWRDRNKSGDKVEHKSLRDVEIKEDGSGVFIARIATLNEIDLDKDITRPGAFPVGKEVLVSAYQHGSWEGELPVGKATIKESNNEVIAEGIFNLMSDTGKEHYESIKFLGGIQEWSYGFKPLEFEYGEEDGVEVRYLKKVDVFEIAPVLKGAGINTTTLAIKGLTYADQSQTVLAAVDDLLVRTKSLADLRRKEGRNLSSTNRDRISQLHKSLAELVDEIKSLLDSTEPIDEVQVNMLLLRYAEAKLKYSEVLN